MEKGKYIMLEGGEGTGKTSHSILIADYLFKKGHNVIFTREPGGTSICIKIRNVLLDPENKDLCSESELFLYGADRAQHTFERIIPGLEQGKIIVSDRGWPSTVSYQGYARGLNMDSIDYINNISTKGLMPDLLFILDVSPEIGLAREKEKDRFGLEKLEFHQMAREGYLKIAEKYKRFSVVVDVESYNKQQVQKQIRKHLEERLGL